MEKRLTNALFLTLVSFFTPYCTRAMDQNTKEEIKNIKRELDLNRTEIKKIKRKLGLNREEYINQIKNKNFTCYGLYMEIVKEIKNNKNEEELPTEEKIKALLSQENCKNSLCEANDIFRHSQEPQFLNFLHALRDEVKKKKYTSAASAICDQTINSSDFWHKFDDHIHKKIFFIQYCGPCLNQNRIAAVLNKEKNEHFKSEFQEGYHSQLVKTLQEQKSLWPFGRREYIYEW